MNWLLHRYEQARASGVSIEKNLLALIGDNERSRSFLLEVLARAQQIPDENTMACWETFVCYGPSDHMDVEGLKKLLYAVSKSFEAYLLESDLPDEELQWHSGTIHEIVSWRLQRTTFIFSVFDHHVSCSAPVFIDQLLTLLVKYEEVVGVTL